MEGKDLDQLFNLGYDRARDGTHHEFWGEVNIDETDQPCYGTTGLPGKLQPPRCFAATRFQLLRMHLAADRLDEDRFLREDKENPLSVVWKRCIFWTRNS